MTPDHDPTRTSPPAGADATRTGGGADVTRTAADTPDAVTQFPADPVHATRGTISEFGTACLAAVGAVEAFQRALSSAPSAAELTPRRVSSPRGSWVAGRWGSCTSPANSG